MSRTSLFDRWLTRSEINAAGRISLFRIIYALFFLWFISHFTYTRLQGVPTGDWQPLLLALWAPQHLPTAFFESLEVVLVAALVLLVIGYHTRTATITVLICGLTLELFRFSFGKVDHATQFLAFYIPLFMAFSHWGSNYSLDSVLRHRREQKTPAPNDPSWRYIWPMRVMMALLVFLFFSAFFYKAYRVNWLTDPQVIERMIWSANLKTLLETGHQNLLARLLVDIPYLAVGLQASALLFEGLFLLALVNRPLRNFFLSVAVIFHVFNWYVLGINFLPMIIIYLIFIDWQDLYERLRVRVGLNVSVPIHIPTWTLPTASVGLAVFVAALWDTTGLSSRFLFSWLSFSMGWIIVTPIALVMFSLAGIALIRWLRILRLPASDRQLTIEQPELPTP